VIYSWIRSTKQRLPDSLLKLCSYINIYLVTLREHSVFSLQRQVDESCVMKKSAFFLTSSKRKSYCVRRFKIFLQHNHYHTQLQPGLQRQNMNGTDLLLIVSFFVISLFRSAFCYIRTSRVWQPAAHGLNLQKDLITSVTWQYRASPCPDFKLVKRSNVNNTRVNQMKTLKYVLSRNLLNTKVTQRLHFST